MATIVSVCNLLGYCDICDKRRWKMKVFMVLVAVLAITFIAVADEYFYDETGQYLGSSQDQGRQTVYHGSDGSCVGSTYEPPTATPTPYDSNQAYEYSQGDYGVPTVTPFED